GLYILDNIRPLEQLADAMKGEKDVFLFDGPPAIRWQTWGRDNPIGAKEWIGQNPPLGAMIDFYSKGSAGPATIQIATAAGQHIRTMVVPVTAGVNRAIWDLRYDASGAGGAPGAAVGRAGGGGRGAGRGAGTGMPAGVPPAQDQAAGRGAGGGGGGGFGRGGGAPYALPGSYVVTVKVGATELTRPLAVQMDPRITVTPADLKAQLDAGLALRDLTDRINALISEADSAVAQLTTTSASNAAAARVLDQAKDFRFRMGRVGQEQGYRIQGRLREEITTLAGSVEANPGAPTAGELVRLKEVTADLDKMTTDWKAFLAGPAAPFVKIS
ncbi:MAG TPA: hypothetical protein VIX35_04975, partial [Vicinamibacterales bacterium]